MYVDQKCSDDINQELVIEINKGNKNFVDKAFYDCEIDVNADLDGCWTFLLFAIDKGHEDIVRFLINAGAKVNLDPHCINALKLAKLRGNWNIINLLEEAGAHPGPYPQTPKLIIP